MNSANCAELAKGSAVQGIGLAVVYQIQGHNQAVERSDIRNPGEC
jgi:hypothetical protein